MSADKEPRESPQAQAAHTEEPRLRGSVPQKNNGPH